MDSRWWPIRLESLLTVATHIIVSLLKAWNMTVVEIECEGAALFQEGPTQEMVSSSKNNFFKFLRAKWQTGLPDNSRYC